MNRIGKAIKGAKTANSLVWGWAAHNRTPRSRLSPHDRQRSCPRLPARGYDSLLTLLSNPQSFPGADDVFLAVARRNGGLREIARILDANPPAVALLHATLASLLETDPAAREPGFVTEHWRTVQSTLAASASGEPATAFQSL